MTHEELSDLRPVFAIAILHRILVEGEYGDMTTEVKAAVRGADLLVNELRRYVPVTRVNEA